MEYHDEPLQFRSYHYFKVKDENSSIVALVIIAITYLPLAISDSFSHLYNCHLHQSHNCLLHEAV